jgi:hypothetical protein
MKKILFTSITLILLFAASSCRKDKIEPFERGFTEEQYADEFDWNTSGVVSLEIFSTSGGFVQVRSTDHSVNYHKGMHPGGSDAYGIQISLPKTVKEIKVNDAMVSVTSENVVVHL